MKKITLLLGAFLIIGCSKGDDSNPVNNFANTKWKQEIDESIYRTINFINETECEFSVVSPEDSYLSTSHFDYTYTNDVATLLDKGTTNVKSTCYLEGNTITLSKDGTVFQRIY